MLGKTIISIIFIPINAIILWAISGIGADRQSYKKALLATLLLFLIHFLDYISIKGFYGSMVSNFIGGWELRVVLSFFVLWGLYRYDWKSLFLMWGIWNILQIPFNILQTKILNLPWDMIMQAF